MIVLLVETLTQFQAEQTPWLCVLVVDILRSCDGLGSAASAKQSASSWEANGPNLPKYSL